MFVKLTNQTSVAVAAVVTVTIKAAATAAAAVAVKNKKFQAIKKSTQIRVDFFIAIFIKSY